MAAASHTHLQLLVVVLFFSAISAQSTGNSTDGKGITHCEKCGNKTDTGLPKGTISQCVVKVPDTSNIRASIFSCNCHPHFTGDGITCNDFDECKERTDNCDSHAHCENTVGSFECECNSGYRGNGIVCADIDECTEAGSEKNASDIYCNGVGNCVNTNGSYSCECGTGYVPDANGTSCIDLDECQSVLTNQCAPTAKCTNTLGSYTCACTYGYKGDGYTCTDFDECEARTDNCDNYAICKNTAGSFECTCEEGFRGSGVVCTNIDECLEGTSRCGENSFCTDIAGSYHCSCNPGFTGDGTHCSDIDECKSGIINQCDQNAVCNNTIGHYTCTCMNGYAGDGYTCTDLDECQSVLTNQCAPTAKCTNTLGSYTCVCTYGYKGDGYTCTADSNMNKDKGQTPHSALLYKYQKLNQERLQLVLKHEEILKRCVNLLQGKQLQVQRARRAVLSEDVKNVESLKNMIAILERRNAELALENHRLDLNCSG